MHIPMQSKNVSARMVMLMETPDLRPRSIQESMTHVSRSS